MRCSAPTTQRSANWASLPPPASACWLGCHGGAQPRTCVPRVGETAVQRAIPYCLKYAPKSHLFVFGSRLAIRSIHTTTPPRIATTPVTTHQLPRTCNADGIPYTCHLLFGNPRHDRSCVIGRRSIARRLLPLCLSHRNPHRSCPAAERLECRAGHAPRRHVATTTPPPPVAPPSAAAASPVPYRGCTLARRRPLAAHP